MPDDRSNLMTCMFRDRDAAERGYAACKARGYTDRDVSVLMSEDARDRWYPPNDPNRTELGSKAGAGAGIGLLAGGGLGAVLAGLAALGVAVPGLPIIAMGPLAGAITGGVTGGVLGAIVGALVGRGIPEDRAKLYEREIKEGGMVFGVAPRSAEDADYLEREWRNCGGEHIYRPGPAEAYRRSA